MKYIRAELHNHTTHSDGQLRVEQLLAYAAENKFETLALTDHNTVSAYRPAFDFAQKEYPQLSLVPGVEITTFYGHILALGLHRMVDLTRLDPAAPGPFLQTLHDAGAVAVGLAHPFCLGHPISEGCRMNLQEYNWELINYIEVANTSGPDAVLGNAQALALWESLVLQEYRLAAVSGKDLHQLPTPQNVFLTYCISPEGAEGTQAERVLQAILTQQTIVTKGPLFCTQAEDGSITVTFAPAALPLPKTTFLLVIQQSDGESITYETDLCTPLKHTLAAGVTSAVIKVYQNSCTYENLLAVGAPLYCEKGEAQR